MKAVLMSIRREHNANIESGKKVTELRTLPPSPEPPFRVYTYESGPDGRHKVVNEWICDLKKTWRMCMGIPAHLPKAACLPAEEILKYSDGGRKDVTELHISNLKIYDKPKELGEFCRPLPEKVLEEGNYDCRKDWDVLCLDAPEGSEYCAECIFGGRVQITRPPQSWCYVEELC